MEHIPNQSLNPEIYLKRFANEDERILSEVHPNTGIIITIPCYAEPELELTLKTLTEATPSKCHTEVIVIVNASDKTPENLQQINQRNISCVKDYQNKNHTNISFQLIDEQALPDKKAGVGLARKMAMDEAVKRFGKINKDGVIVCLDGDCTVSKNYLIEIEKFFFYDYPQSNGAELYFEHPIQSIQSEQLKQGIIEYELHLRYYIACQEFCKCPYAFHTVGSSMAARSSAYQKQGGMNIKKAGEDFYFLHKIISLGNFGRIQNLSVYPSPRVSSRVPFGTGRAQENYLKTGKELQTYAFEIFKDIKGFTDCFTKLSHNPKLEVKKLCTKEVFNFLVQENFSEAFEEMKKNTASPDSLNKRLWQWMNAFRLMKLTHFLRDHKYPNENINKAVKKYLNHTQEKYQGESNEELLEFFRNQDKHKQAYPQSH